MCFGDIPRDHAKPRKYFCGSLQCVGEVGWMVWYIENGGSYIPYQKFSSEFQARNAASYLNKEELEKAKKIRNQG